MTNEGRSSKPVASSIRGSAKFGPPPPRRKRRFGLRIRASSVICHLASVAPAGAPCMSKTWISRFTPPVLRARRDQQKAPAELAFTRDFADFGRPSPRAGVRPRAVGSPGPAWPCLPERAHCTGRTRCFLGHIYAAESAIVRIGEHFSCDPLTRIPKLAAKNAKKRTAGQRVWWVPNHARFFPGGPALQPSLCAPCVLCGNSTSESGFNRGGRGGRGGRIGGGGTTFPGCPARDGRKFPGSTRPGGSEGWICSPFRAWHRHCSAEEALVL